MLPISLRSAESEQRYQEYRASGQSKDIAHVAPNEIIENTKILKNFFPYDLTYKVNDMTLGNTNEDWMVWWMNVGIAIQEGKFNEYNQFVYNMPAFQSQPHVPHGHLVCFDEEMIKYLRKCITYKNRRSIE